MSERDQGADLMIEREMIDIETIEIEMVEGIEEMIEIEIAIAIKEEMIKSRMVKERLMIRI